MTRLTVKVPHTGTHIMKPLSEESLDFLNKNNLNIDATHKLQLALAIDKLGYYEDMEEQGLLITLPLKPGDTYWIIVPYDNRLVTSHCNPNKEPFVPYISKHTAKNYADCVDVMEHLGTTYFLSETEAQIALAKEVSVIAKEDL